MLKTVIMAANDDESRKETAIRWPDACWGKVAGSSKDSQDEVQ